MRHTGIPFFGYYPAAKAITGLLKVAANLVPQSLLPGTFTCIFAPLFLFFLHVYFWVSISLSLKLCLPLTSSFSLSNAHTILLPHTTVLFRAVDVTLCQISASKAALRTISLAQSTATSSSSTSASSSPSDTQGQKSSNTSLKSKYPSPSDSNILKSPGQIPDLGSNSWPKRRSRSRGNSVGSQVKQGKEC